MEQFTIVKRGYDTDEVDRYVGTLEQVIKSYKDKDSAIKNAIISAQVAADNMVKNAKMQSDEYKAQIMRELKRVSAEVERQRVKLQAFYDIYASLVRKYLTPPVEEDMKELFSKLDDVDKLINILMDEGEQGDEADGGSFEGYDDGHDGEGLPPAPGRGDYF